MITRTFMTCGLAAMLVLSAVGAAQAQFFHLGLENRQVNCLELRQDGAQLYLGTEDGIETLLLGSYTYLPPGELPGANVISLLSLGSDSLLAGVESGDQSIYRRTATGWSGFQNNYGGGAFHPAFAFSRIPGQSSGLLATGISVIAKSDDDGQSWREVWGAWENMAMGVVFVQPDTNHPGVIWAGGEAAIFAPWLFKSTDYGETWDLVPVIAAGDNRCHDIAIHPDDPDIAWVSMEGMIIKTVDGGQHWDDVLVNDFYLYAIEIDPSQPWRLYCTGAKGNTPLTLFYSRDYGETWQGTCDDTYSANAAYDMVLRPRSTGCELFVGTDHGLFAYVDDYKFCCEGRVGDANGDGSDEPTVADIGTLIDFLFISMEPSLVLCLPEADINQSGLYSPTPDDITISDISILIDYLFITGPSLGLPDCL